MADIQHAIAIAATPEAIYPLVATAHGLAQWWAADVSEPPGAVELGFFNRATVYRLRLVADRPALGAEWACDSGDEWRGTRLLFELASAKAGATLRFVHADWRAESDYFTSCNTTWGALMFRLKAAAEGRKPGPLFEKDSMAY